MHDQNLGNREQDDLLHVLHTGAFQPGVDPSSSFPPIGQTEIDLAGNDRYLHATK